MNEENKKIIWSEILKAGDFLKNKLPEHPHHPKGRNSYAHVSLEIKNKFNQSYIDLPDKIIKEVTDYIEFIKKNPY
tara:strand:- start:326 stop:553 length:228 start_codon:yes stop_codon:yes gene_type:complete